MHLIFRQAAGSFAIVIAQSFSASILLAGTLSTPAAATEVALVNDGGVYTVPVRINGVITLKFVVDSGASEVQIPADVALTLIRTGTVAPQDFLSRGVYQQADGSLLQSARFVLRRIEIADHVVENVDAFVGSPGGPLLLGQSALGRLPAWSLDNRRHVLILADEASQAPAVPAPSAGSDPVALVQSYYGMLNRKDAESAIACWASPNVDRLRSLIQHIEWFELKEVRLLTEERDRAAVWVDLVGKNQGEPTRRWFGPVDLVNVAGHWRIVTLRQLKPQM